METYNLISSELKGVKPEFIHSTDYEYTPDPNHNPFQFLIPLDSFSVIIGLDRIDEIEPEIDIIEVLDDCGDIVPLSLPELAYLKADLLNLNYSI